MIKTGAFLFVIGAIFGTMGDAFHVLSQTDGYFDSLLFLPFIPIPFWVPILFGSAAASIGLSHLWFQRHLGRPHHFEKPWGAWIAGILFMILYAASGFLHLPTGSEKDWVLLFCSFTMILTFYRSWQGVLLALVTAVMGTAVEISLVQWGAFYYYPDVANFYGVPSWLPWLYCAASVTIDRITDAIFSRIS